MRILLKEWENNIYEFRKKVDKIEEVILMVKDLVLSHEERLDQHHQNLDDFYKAMDESRKDFDFKINALIDLEIRKEFVFLKSKKESKNLKINNL